MPHFLITGGAGFIGSNLVHFLLSQGHKITVVDDFSTGRTSNLAGIADQITLVRASICDTAALGAAFAGVDYCLHQAAIPSVPRSVADPLASNRANVEGTLGVLIAARDAGLRRVVLASSSSVYGPSAGQFLSEFLPRSPISPYAVSKAACEMYAEVFTRLYGMEVVALRYFNVFGPRQDPNSPYAAVIPLFIRRMMRGEPPIIYGDGLQARDFTYVDNVVQANVRACEHPGPLHGIFNVGCGHSVRVLDLAAALNALLGMDLPPESAPARPGDIRDSCADITRAREAFGYHPVVDFTEGLRRTAAWLRTQESLDS